MIVLKLGKGKKLRKKVLDALDKGEERIKNIIRDFVKFENEIQTIKGEE